MSRSAWEPAGHLLWPPARAVCPLGKPAMRPVGGWAGRIQRLDLPSNVRNNVDLAFFPRVSDLGVPRDIKKIAVLLYANNFTFLPARGQVA